MTEQEMFHGKPLFTEPSDNWNQPPYWEDYYAQLMSNEGRPHEREWVVYREVELLIRMLVRLRELPRPKPERGGTLLDAGCGIALIPHVLAYWGFHVTAVDSCIRAFELARQARPSEPELARCIPIWDPVDPSGACHLLVEDPERSLEKLRRYHVPGGGVRHVHSDWNDDGLPRRVFDLIYCRNSLRGSTKPYWRRSLHRFHELLAPGGVLLLETLNAIRIRDEVEVLLRESGLVELPPNGDHPPLERYVVAMWPTG